jgi:dihydroxyacetone kinase-like predicted kinase
MKTINGQQLKQLFLSGANNLYNHYPEIDQLNVFPVPDGDTGMNMNLTLTSGPKKSHNKNDESVARSPRASHKGLLMGARGNSGVITSQIFRGIAQGMSGKGQRERQSLPHAFVKGKEVAYKAVMRPVEGTILTVIRESSAALDDSVKKETTIEEALDILLKEAKKSLQHTPDLLPILKEVGVVDSRRRRPLRRDRRHGECRPWQVRRTQLTMQGTQETTRFSTPYAGAKLSEDEEGYGYCTQFILRLGKPRMARSLSSRKNSRISLATHGKSLVFVRDDDIVKVHVHTLNPGIDAELRPELWRVFDDHDREYVRRAQQHLPWRQSHGYGCQYGPSESEKEAAPKKRARTVQGLWPCRREQRHRASTRCSTSSAST